MKTANVYIEPRPDLQVDGRTPEAIYASEGGDFLALRYDIRNCLGDLAAAMTQVGEIEPVVSETKHSASAELGLLCRYAWRDGIETRKIFPELSALHQQGYFTPMMQHALDLSSDELRKRIGERVEPTDSELDAAEILVVFPPDSTKNVADEIINRQDMHRDTKPSSITLIEEPEDGAFLRVVNGEGVPDSFIPYAFGFITLLPEGVVRVHGGTAVSSRCTKAILNWLGCNQDRSDPIIAQNQEANKHFQD